MLVCFYQAGFFAVLSLFQKWVDLFDEYPVMMAVETAIILKGMHNLMSAHFDLLNYEKLADTMKEFEKFAGIQL